jgi:lipoprotein-anchoring transpeptidase ErfK/SrfK
MKRTQTIAQRASAVAGLTLLLSGNPFSSQASAAELQDPAPSPATPARSTPEWLAVQVALDRAGFSPGEIDGRSGPNTRTALEAFRRSRQLPAGEALDDALLAALGPVVEKPLVTYVITAEDTAGPFVERLPADMMEKASLESLGYTSVLELLGERFHVSPTLLEARNPGRAFAAGETILVPDVEPFSLPEGSGKRLSVRGGPKTESASARAGLAADQGHDVSGASHEAGVPAGRTSSTGSPERGLTVIVTKGTSALTVQDARGAVRFHAPVTIGSTRDPLPLGRWSVTGVFLNPVFHYNPDLFWDADPAHAKARIAPGPNNPVGPIWIDLTKEHYGFHGTPEPSTIGHTQSHGCIRLTNWDAARLAALVDEGTEVVFQ